MYSTNKSVTSVFAPSDFMPFKEGVGYDPLNSEFRRRIPNLPLSGKFVVSAKDEYRLDLISYRLYGSTSYWWILLDYNSLSSAEDVVVGAKLAYPSLSDINNLYYTVENYRGYDSSLESSSLIAPEVEDYTSISSIPNSIVFSYSDTKPKKISISPSGASDSVTWKLDNSNFTVLRMKDSSGLIYFNVYTNGVNFDSENDILGGITFLYTRSSGKVVTARCDFKQKRFLEQSLEVVPPEDATIFFDGWRDEETKSIFVKKVTSYGTPPESSKFVLYAVDSSGNETVVSSSKINSWLSYSVDSEDAYGGTINFKATKNTSGLSRSVSLRIRLSDSETASVIVSVNQRYEYPLLEASPSYLEFEYESNVVSYVFVASSLSAGDVSYSVHYSDTNDTGWIVVGKEDDNGNYSVSVSGSPQTMGRSGWITWSSSNGGSATAAVYQKFETVELRAAPSSINFVSLGDNSEVVELTSRTSDESDWSNEPITGSSVSDEWISLSSVEGESNKRTVNVRISELGINNSGAVVLASTKGRKVVPVRTGRSLPWLSPYPTVITTTAISEGMTYKITVTRNEAAGGVVAEVPSDVDWIDVSAPQESGMESVFTVKVLSNNTTVIKRNTSILFKSLTGDVVVRVSVNQGEFYFTIAPDSLEFDSNGGTRNLTISPDSDAVRSIMQVDVDYEEGSSWITSTQDELKHGVIKVAEWT